MNTNSTKLQYKFLLTLSTAYLAVDINIQGFLALMPFVQGEFAINRALAGLYSTSFFLFAAVIAIFTGSIVDKIGSKKGLVFGTISVGTLIILHSLASDFYILLLLALFTGLVFSIITPSLNKAVMQKVSSENRATSMGIMQMGGGVGDFLGATFLPLLAEMLGWRTAILFSGLIAIIIGFFISSFYREKISKVKRLKNNNIKKHSFIESIKILFKNKNLLIVCFLGFAFGSSTGALPTHYTLYLTQDINLNTATAGLCLGIFQIGGIVAISWMGLFFTAISELVSKKLTGIGTGFALIFLRSGIIISPPLFGYLADLTGSYQISWMTSSLIMLIFTITFIFIVKKEKIFF